MCVVSMVGDYYQQKWQGIQWPSQQQFGAGAGDVSQIGISGVQFMPPISRAEFDELKKEVLEMKELLKRAKEYDAKNNEPDCELETKIAMLRKVAEAVGVSLDDVFERKPTR